MFDGPRPWAMTVTAAAFAFAAASACAQAQGVYRIVGSDGRVTYSDQPPPTVAPNGRVDVLRAPKGMPSLVPPAPSPLATTDEGGDGVASRSPGAPRRAQRAEPREPAGRTTAVVAPAAVAVDPAVEAAMIGVLGIEDVVKRTESICVSTLPTSARRYSGAVDEWVRRNQRTVLVARRVLSRQYDVETREAIEAGIARRNAGQFVKIVEAAPAARIAWCDRSAAEIAGGRMDVFDKPKLAGPLADLPAR